MRRTAPEHADSRGSVEFVARERVEIDAQLTHVDWQVLDRLRAVDQHRHFARVCHLGDLRDWIDGTQGI